MTMMSTCNAGSGPFGLVCAKASVQLPCGGCSVVVGLNGSGLYRAVSSLGSGKSNKVAGTAGGSVSGVATGWSQDCSSLACSSS